MRIGFDAKRAFHNGTGLGHYSRTLLQSLSKYFPDHEYYLFNPKKKSRFEVAGENLHEVNPNHFLHQAFSSLWRSNWVKKDLRRLEIDLYHGLSHEIPVGIQKTKTRSVVTIHDLVHERFPEQYSAIDVKIYSQKFRYACRNADRIIAISENTRKDIVEMYGTDPAKIDVCYQSCNPAFAESVSDEGKTAIQKKYQLPERFFLYVGSIIERKNLLNVCKALPMLSQHTRMPLVVIGDGKQYKKKVKEWLAENDLGNQVIFLSEKTRDPGFLTARDFPAIYQCATAMIYPSFYEGFGIPVLEALWSRLPVITSSVSCLPEAGGEAAWYVNPANPGEIAEGMEKIVSDPAFAASMKEKGLQHAQNFTPRRCADRVMAVYLGVISRR